MARIALPLVVTALALVACTSREADPTPDASSPPVDAGSADAGGRVDAHVPSDAGPGDAGSCELDCPAIPEECHYEDQDCAEESCGEIVCPDPERLCGGLFHGFCPSTEYCDYALEGVCGIADEVGYCRARPSECSAECEEVCGCDDVTYCNACEAHRAGREVRMPGACPPPDPCHPFDAFGEGECTDVLGYQWNGSGCARVVGCTCAGGDCGRLEVDEAACEATFAECFVALCRPMDARAMGDCTTSLGWAWDGDACVELVGCDCDGTECFRVEGTRELCEAPYDRCVPPPA